MLKIVPIESRKDLKTFLKFNIQLYEGNPYAVPSLISDDLNYLDPTKNPAFEFCETQCFLCYRDNKIVGRINAFINHKANKAWNKLEGRFGFIDFVEDFEVAKLLIDTAESWVKERGMTSLTGPLGFTDMDPEGMLIEGFDQISTMITIYNYPYYPEYLERLGFIKAADWIEMKVFTPEELPERVMKVAQIVETRSGVKIYKPKSARQLVRDGWGYKIFELTNLAYANLFGYSQLTEQQIEAFAKQYVPMLNLDFVTIVVDKDDKLIGFGIGLPSLAKALQKAKGKMLPFGFFHLLKALKAKECEVVDFMLIAIHPQWQGKGINSLIIKDFFESFKKHKTIYAETNPELETNTQIQDQWIDFKHFHHKRRRAFTREIK